MSGASETSEAAPEEFGQFVADNIIGVNHDHFFSFCLNLDVDGQNNSFVAHRFKQRQLPASTLRKTIWVPEHATARSERDAMTEIHLDRPSMWLLENPNVRGPLGYPLAYEIMPWGQSLCRYSIPQTGRNASARFLRISFG
jgi:primary-amine oxidase